jgi:hypothetical protein
MIYIYWRLCYRPQSVTEMFLFHDMKNRKHFYTNIMTSLDSSSVILSFEITCLHCMGMKASNCKIAKRARGKMFLR